MNIMKRWSSKTPKFWKKVQRIAITVGAVGGVIISAPVAMPAFILTLSGYAITAGTVAAALSQLTIETNEQRKELH
jgi:ABC-type xylose transport system permease subunit